MKNFYDLFNHELRDIHNAEEQLAQLLPELASAAHTPKLKELFEQEQAEAQDQVERLERIAKDLNIQLGGRECAAMRVFADEAKKTIAADYPEDVMDAALISSAQRIKHYEIALYGTLKAFARHLGLKDAERLLNLTSKEEGAIDKKLTEIAVGTVFSSGVNQKAIRKSA